MKFGRMLAVIAAIGGAMAALGAHGEAVRGAPIGPMLGLNLGGGNHRHVAPNPTGTLRIRRAAVKRRNQAQHRRNCRGRR